MRPFCEAKRHESVNNPYIVGDHKEQEEFEELKDKTIQLRNELIF